MTLCGLNGRLARRWLKCTLAVSLLSSRARVVIGVVEHHFFGRRSHNPFSPSGLASFGEPSLRMIWRDPPLLGVTVHVRAFGHVGRFGRREHNASVETTGQLCVHRTLLQTFRSALHCSRSRTFNIKTAGTWLGEHCQLCSLCRLEREWTHRKIRSLEGVCRRKMVFGI